MRIGEDFDKISFEFLGMDLLEPNSFIGDTLIFIVAMFFMYKLNAWRQKNDFFRYWHLFFLVFGISFFLGGFGHLLYNYWGIAGKTPSWYLGIIASFCIEMAMISLHNSDRFKKLFSMLSKIKLVAALIAALCVSLFVDLEADYSKGMTVPTINSTIGMFFSLGYLAVHYGKENKGFYYFLFGLLMLIPAAAIQAVKLNLHQWFDKNDFGHVLLIISLFFYFAGIKSYAEKSLNK